MEREGGEAELPACRRVAGKGEVSIQLFREQVGLTPKRSCRALRFQQVIDPTSEPADDCGYADQAHLRREFREFSGFTPTEYLRLAWIT